jgi:hypothetical protein
MATVLGAPDSAIHSPIFRSLAMMYAPYDLETSGFSSSVAAARSRALIGVLLGRADVEMGVGRRKRVPDRAKVPFLGHRQHIALYSARTHYISERG